MKKYTRLALFAVLLLGPLSIGLFSQGSPHAITVSWTPPSGGGQVTGYNVKRSTTTGTETVTIGSTTAAVLTYVDPFQLTDEGKKFFYVVTATGPGGESVPSNETSQTIPFSVPGAPSGAVSTVR